MLTLALGCCVGALHVPSFMRDTCLGVVCGQAGKLWQSSGGSDFFGKGVEFVPEAPDRSREAFPRCHRAQPPRALHLATFSNLPSDFAGRGVAISYLSCDPF